MLREFCLPVAPAGFTASILWIWAAEMLYLRRGSWSMRAIPLEVPWGAARIELGRVKSRKERVLKKDGEGIVLVYKQAGSLK